MNKPRFYKANGQETGVYVALSLTRDKNGEPQAELRTSGPETEGSDPIYTPSEIMPVPKAIIRGEMIARQHGVPFLVRTNEVPWNASWGELWER